MGNLHREQKQSVKIIKDMRITDTQITDAITEKCPKLFLYDTTTAKGFWNRIFVINAYDKVDCKCVDFIIRYIDNIHSGDMHDLLKLLRSGAFNDHRRERAVLSLRWYCSTKFRVDTLNERYDVLDVHIEDATEEYL